MTNAVGAATPTAEKPGPKYEVDIEGKIYPWDRDTITPAEIRQLGGLPTDTPVLEINLKDNTQRQLPEDKAVEIKPGHGFSKKVRFQRG